MTVSGSLDLVPKRSLRVESGCVKVALGEPIPTAGLEVADRGALKERVRRAIESGFDPAFQGQEPISAPHEAEPVAS